MSWKIWGVEHENLEKLMKSGEIKFPYNMPEGWRWVRLEELCEKSHYGYTASAEYSAVGPKLLRITDIQNGKVNWDTVPYCRCEKGIDHYLLRPGDILVARTGGTTGKSYLISKPPAQAIFASYLLRGSGRLFGLTGKGTFYELRKGSQRAQTAQKGITKGLNEQREFGKIKR